MQGDGQTDDRTKSGASGRTPPVIDAQAVEVAASAGEKPTASGNLEGDDAVPQHIGSPQEAAEVNGAELANGEVANGEQGAPADAIAAPPPRKTRRGTMAAIFGLIVVGAAGAVAWIATPGHREGDMKSRIIALLPQSAQRALHRAPAQQPAETTAQPSSPADVRPSAQADKPAPADMPKTEPAKPEASNAEPTKTGPEKQAATEPKPAGTSDQAASGAAQAPSPPAPAGGAQTGNMTVVGNPPVAIGVDPARIEDMSVKIDSLQAKVDGLQSKLDATLGRLDSLQSKLDLAQGKLDVVPSADAVTQAAQRIETLTQRLAAMEQKLEQPKTDTRAPQARENTTPSGREFAASRAVVAQATSEALRAGAPLADNLAALKGLGVADDRIGDLAPYAKAGAPTATQLTAQWRGLRDKVLALDAPPPGASFGDKLMAKAKSVFRVTWAGQGAQNSIGSTAARVDAALQRNDLAGAVAACNDFPAVAKNVVADWQTAAAARLKADAAARALVSESISAIGRSSSQ